MHSISKKTIFSLVSAALLMLPAAGAWAADYYIDAATGDNANPGTVSLPFKTIQQGINSAAVNDTIHVVAGTYRESLTWSSKDLTIQGAGGGISIVDPSVANGGPGGRCLSTNNLTNASRISGFTFQGGSAVSGRGSGGGIQNTNSSLRVDSCTVSGNSASTAAGIRNSNSSPIIINCTFSNNSATSAGGGIGNVNNSSPTITNCIFDSNMYGSGIHTVGGSIRVTNCRFKDNWGQNGGGIYLEASTGTTITNCVFWENIANSGGGIYSNNSSPQVTNCTFNRNDTAFTCGGIYVTEASTAIPTVTNCILWGDHAPEISGSAIVTYSDVQGLPHSTPDTNGNFSSDPYFWNVYSGDLRPTYYPWLVNLCFDRGNNAVVTSPAFVTDGDGVINDVKGTPRIWRGTVDIGAYEYRGAWDVTDQIQVTRGGLRRNNATGRYIQQITLVNIGSTTITGPIAVAAYLNSGVTLFNKTGTTTSDHIYVPTAYIDVAGDLAPGVSKVVTLEFTNPTNGPISSSIRVYDGTGTR